MPIYNGNDIPINPIREEETMKKDVSPVPFSHLQVGMSGYGTRFGIIDGPLVQCDGWTATFDTPYGQMRVDTNEIISSPFTRRP